MSDRNSELIRRDLNVLFHPTTQMKDHHDGLPLIPVEEGRGAWLKDRDGKWYLDAISSWWVNLFGHCNPRINEAVRGQLERLEHVILAGCSHEPAVQLAERLVALSPKGLERVFFTDNGSSSIEVALKMSHHYWRNTGHPEKTRYINLSNSYHGDTIGALSVGDVGVFKDAYEPLLMEPITVPSPDCFHREPGTSWAEHSEQMFVHMEAALQEHGHETAAVILEPLVQGAGGMRMYDPVYLQRLREACDRHGVHLIADEIATGFGRTGTLFACEQAGIAPDFMCVSKGITGGYLPLAAVLLTEPVYQAFFDDFTRLTGFLHSHSYTGNPLACAAALATLGIFDSDDVLARNRETAQRMAEAAAPLAGHPHVGEVRQQGMILAMEMVRDPGLKTPFPWQERRGLIAYRHALERGVLMRPIGNVLYWMPPYVIEPDEIALLGEVAAEAIDRATRD
ncbi:MULTISPECIES: adenosylmethionine--8-amino-7-oxononanoate transaminase [Halorhodospira]|uniref:adenosylmethionine--8-amino-7-oxononanoate transaminase n=1 Tax=Halorhodospira TaxID=85108 RepID=UPI0019124F0E|nr:MULTISPECIES: adenosylmethionine--8-amino-7-oxononanoate transaminase [Halorhodospira]MBK5935907.1 adenosylmethionine--8-amino-7-oxononanoate transaminase [Halorhodospira halophila]MBK5943253.1 adenosylmethionine--8-amino-7-oxononanoate transaminase [Halorhodospira halophila]MCG5526775.1 adenosylmethionine--8-amino-7-oxononanoate transaminase [Halorhodospira halophila]MCG5542888.1 adenosylmethionine--8-amino-7-oxononanoate transaminase [Halorhodospira sp. 9628]